MDVIEVDRQWGRILELLRLRGRYTEARRKVGEGAPWRHGGQAPKPISDERQANTDMLSRSEIGDVPNATLTAQERP